VSVERIEACFARCRAENRPALVIYLTTGDPSVADTLACARAALASGADLLELGVPFSDPTADGPVIAAASQRAIAGGASLRGALELAREIRQESEAPLVLFTYLNPVLAFGEDALPSALEESGIDALLVVDLPPEEGASLRSRLSERKLGTIPLVAPTTGDERVRRIAGSARGFVYYVSSTGVTGLGGAPLAEAAQRAKEIAGQFAVPVVVGFGVDGPEKANALARAGVDGVVVGSAIVKALAAEPTPEGRVRAVRERVTALRRALDRD